MSALSDAKGRYQSWGRFPKSRQDVILLTRRDARLPVVPANGKYLPFGNGRSYGDSCLNDGGILLDCRGLNRVISFDTERGIVTCEAGVLLSELLELIVPYGWFLPVTPGTKFVTVGGAIASDVHGKNHHRRGTFGCRVRAFELLRSDGQRRICSPTREKTWFDATIGGLGLTGLITWVELHLIPIRSDRIDMDVVRFTSLQEFMELAQSSDADYEYSVAWVDSLATGSSVGRGIFVRGNHATPEEPTLSAGGPARITIPFTPARTLINRASLQLLNTLYYRMHSHSMRRRTLHYEGFFYPLDRIANWNRLYGPHGLLQHQSVVPFAGGIEAIHEMLARTIKAKLGSFLTVLKVFGDVPSPGLLSFPRPGITLALDFPNHGAATFRLLDELDEVTLAAGGAVNPCKDAHMCAENFRSFFPRWREFVPFVDPMFSSSLWRRVNGEC